jgi:predicted dehydrogenase
VAIADAAPAALSDAGQLVPGARLYQQEAQLWDSDLDGVVIATPSAQHAAEACAALDRGLAVFCQKPLGRTGAEVRSVVEAARRADRLLGVDLSYRSTAAGRALRALVGGGALGRIYAVNLVFHNAYGPDKAWFYRRAAAGGGCLVDLGIHLVDLALWCLGFPRVESAHAALRAGGGRVVSTTDAVEDYASAQLELESGAVVQLACSWRLPAGRDAVIEAAFYGTEGGASLRNVGGSFYDFTCERFQGTQTELLVSPPDDWSGRAAVEWVERLCASPRFDAVAERYTEVAEVLDRLYAA